MCTLLVAHHATPGTPLAVSGNRNEFLERPAEPLAPRDDGIVSPRDGKAGGTWLGLNDRGVFVSLTNRRRAQLDPARRSRGQLVADALRLSSAREVADWLGRITPSEYNGFHLVAADLREAFLGVCDGERLQRSQLAPGLHLITERSFGAGEGLREERCSAAFEPLFAAGEPTAQELRVPMTGHGPHDEPLESACVHGERFGYGTRSSFQLVVPATGAVSALWTEGAPCTNAPRDVSAWLAPLFAR